MSDTKGRLEIGGSGITAVSHFALEARRSIHQAGIALLATVEGDDWSSPGSTKARWSRAKIHAAADMFENALELTA